MAAPLRRVLALALVVSACSRPPESEPPVAAPVADPAAPALSSERAPEDSSRTGSELAAPMPSPAPPVLTTIRSGGGALVTLTFRTAAGVPLSESNPLVLNVGDRVFEASLSAGPARFTDPDGTVVDQASYVLGGGALRALASAPADSVTVSVALPDAYADFPYVSGDLVE